VTVQQEWGTGWDAENESVVSSTGMFFEVKILLPFADFTQDRAEHGRLKIEQCKLKFQQGRPKLIAGGAEPSLPKPPLTLTTDCMSCST